MKNEYLKINLTIQVLQGMLWIALYLVFPLLACLQAQDFSNFRGLLQAFSSNLYYSTFLYFINFYLLIPGLLFKRKRVWFFSINTLLLLIDKIPIFIFHAFPEDTEQAIYVKAGLGFYTFLLVFVIIGAVSVRYILRWNEMQYRLKEKKQKDTEAELTWLKNQLNPHFLFNTLNNISSLIQIDTDTAQESIGQLSDLLRYALYDSNQPKVPIQKEIEFIRNYIDLMKLRSETTRIELQVAENLPPVSIIPLLFISPIENAFKHSSGTREASFIRIEIACDEQQSLCLKVSNSYHPHTDTHRIGSGIGIENLRRRLELAYPNNYEYHQQIENQTYHVTIIIHHCL